MVGVNTVDNIEQCKGPTAREQALLDMQVALQAEVDEVAAKYGFPAGSIKATLARGEPGRTPDSPVDLSEYQTPTATHVGHIGNSIHG